MTSDMFAPEIQSYIHWLGNMEHHGVGSQFLFDEKSHVHLNDLFKTLQSLDPVNDNGVYELWLRANRGRLEDFGDFEEYRDAGEVESYAEFEQLWVSEFPDETEWHHFTAVEDPLTGFRAVTLDHRLVLEVDPHQQPNPMHDLSKFTGWLVEAVEEVIHRNQSRRILTPSGKRTATQASHRYNSKM